MKSSSQRPIRDYPSFPSKHLATVLSCWSLCDSGLVNVGSSFTIRELEQAIMNNSPLYQSELIVAVHICLARILGSGRSSSTIADTTTWRSMVVRAACFCAGYRVRSRVRHLLTEQSTAVLETDDPQLEFKAILGSIGIHPIFSDEVRKSLLESIEKEDVLESALLVLTPYGKSAVDALEILVSLVRFRKTSGIKEDEHQDLEEGKEEKEETVHIERRGRPMKERDPSLGPEPQTTAEEDEKLSQALVKLELQEYSQIDLDTKCFLLQWICDQVIDSKYIQDLMENAEEKFEEEEFVLEDLRDSHVENCESERMQQYQGIIDQLRERTREDYLRKKFAEDWMKQQEPKKPKTPPLPTPPPAVIVPEVEEEVEEVAEVEEQAPPESPPPELGQRRHRTRSTTKSLRPVTRSRTKLRVARASSSSRRSKKSPVKRKSRNNKKFIDSDDDDIYNDEDDEYIDPDEEAEDLAEEENLIISSESSEQEELFTGDEKIGFISHRQRRQIERMKPGRYKNKKIQRTLFGVTRSCFVKRWSRNEQNELLFHCEYENSPFFETLSAYDVMKGSSSDKECSDEILLSEHCSLANLECLTQVQVKLLADVLQQRGLHQSVERRAAFDLLSTEMQSEFNHEIGRLVSTPYGNGFILGKIELTQAIAVQMEYGAIGYLQPKDIKPAAQMSFTSLSFETNVKNRLAIIQATEEKIRKMKLTWRVPLLAKDPTDGSMVFPKSPDELLIYPAPAMNEMEDEEEERYGRTEVLMEYAHKADFEKYLKQVHKKTADLTFPALEWPTGPFQPPPYILSDSLRHIPGDDCFQPLTHVSLILSRLASDLQPWIPSGFASALPSAKSIPSLESAKLLLLDLEARLILGLASCTIYKSYHEFELKSIEPLLPTSPEEISVQLPEESAWGKRGGRYQIGAKTLAELLKSLSVPLEDAWKIDATREQICQAAPFEGGIATRCAAVLDAIQRNVLDAWQLANNDRSRFIEFREKFKNAFSVKNSVVPALASCSDGALMYLIRWLPRRRIWRTKVTNLQSFSTLVVEANRMLRDTFELRRAGSCAGVPREDVVKADTFAGYFPSIHHQFVKEHSATVPWYLPPTVDVLFSVDDSERKKIQVLRTDQHCEYTIVGLSAEELDPEEIALKEAEIRARMEVLCVISGCERKAVIGNYGHCEIHRLLRRRGRPPIRAIARTATSDEGEQQQQQQQQPEEPQQDIAFYSPKKETDSRKNKKQDSRPPPVENENENDNDVPFVDDDICYICFEGGELLCCDYPRCPKVYHQECLGPKNLPIEVPEGEPDIPWQCPLHRLSETSYEKKLQTAIIGILDSVSLLENAELLAGKHDSQSTSSSNEQRADCLRAIRTKCIVDAKYTSFDEFAEDFEALRDRFTALGEANNSQLLLATVHRIFKFTRTRIGRARVGVEGPKKDLRNPLIHSLRTTSERKASKASFLREEVAGAEERESQHFLEGEELDPSSYYESFEPGSDDLVSPGKVLFHFATALEMGKANVWPQAWERCERIHKPGYRDRNKRKNDDFSDVDRYTPIPGEQVIVLYRNAPAAYLISERRAQKEDGIQKCFKLREIFLESLKTCENAIEEYQQQKKIAERAWYLFLKEMMHTITEEETNELKFLSNQFLLMSLSFGIGLDNKKRELQYRTGEEIRHYKKIHDDIPTTQVSQSLVQRLTSQYNEFKVDGNSLFQTKYEMENSDVDEEVIRVFDDVVSAVETIEESGYNQSKDVYVTLVLDEKRLTRPSGQRLVAPVKRGLSERAPHYATHRIGGQVFVRLTQDDDYGWPAEIMDCTMEEVDGKVTYLFDVEYEHGYSEKNVHQDRLILKPCSDPVVLKANEPVVVAINKEIYDGKLIRIDRRSDECRVVFKETGKQMVVNSSQVRPVPWILRAEEVEEHALSQLNSKRKEPLSFYSQPKSYKNYETRDLVGVRFIRGEVALGSSSLPALLPTVNEELIVEIGDAVEVLTEVTRKGLWRDAVVIKIEDGGLVQVKILETGKKSIVDVRHLRRPQPEPDFYPFEMDFVSKEERKTIKKRIKLEKKAAAPTTTTTSIAPLSSFKTPKFPGGRSRKTSTLAVALVKPPRSSKRGAVELFPIGTHVFVDYEGTEYQGIITQKPVGFEEFDNDLVRLYSVYYPKDSEYENDVLETRIRFANTAKRRTLPSSGTTPASPPQPSVDTPSYIETTFHDNE